MLVTYKDTEKLMVSQDSRPQRRRSVYTTTRCCKTRTSIIVTKSIVLLAGVTLLLVGAVLAGSIHHQPVGCDEMNTSNSSLEWRATLLVSPNPTRTSIVGETGMITPSPTWTHASSPFSEKTIPMISPSPSFN